MSMTHLHTSPDTHNTLSAYIQSKGKKYCGSVSWTARLGILTFSRKVIFLNNLNLIVSFVIISLKDYTQLQSDFVCVCVCDLVEATL